MTASTTQQQNYFQFRKLEISTASKGYAGISKDVTHILQTNKKHNY